MSTIPAALQFLFDPGETPWAPLPDPGVRPNVAPSGSIILGASDFTLGANEAILGNGPLFFAFEGPNVTNFGTIWTESDFFNVHFNSGSNFGLIQNHGVMVALSKFASAIVVGGISRGIFQNFGTVVVATNKANAIGINSFSTSLPEEVFVPLQNKTPYLNAGDFYVWSQAASAFGIALQNGGRIVNTGLLEVSGFAGSVGVLINNSTLFENSGTLRVQAGPGSQSIGFEFTFGDRRTFTLVNTGDISADIALRAQNHTFTSPLQKGLIDITNSGTISGEIILSGSQDNIVNTGIVNGDVFLGSNDDVFDNSAGVLNGTVFAGSGDDVLLMSGANESLFGEDGNDTLSGGAGADTIDGGLGIDVASYADHAAAIIANIAQQSVGGAAAGDVLISIEGIIGTPFNDSLLGDDGDNFFDGGAGADTISAGLGVDLISYGSAASGVFVDIETGQTSLAAAGDVLSGFENISGSSFGDTLIGDAGSNRIDGADGNDFLSGGSGDDTFVLSAGADNINGGAGFDNVDYSSAQVAGISVNLMTGQTSGVGGDVLSGVEKVIAGFGDDTLVGDAAANWLIGGQGFNYFEGGAGADTIEGGGADTISYANELSGVVVSLIDNLNGGGAAGDVISGIAVVIGSAFNDSITGDDNSGTLFGGAGDDTLIGGAGFDILTAGSGNNLLDGGGGNDFFMLSGGIDSIFGGAGVDVIDFSGAATGVEVDLATGNGGGALAGARFVNIENIEGSASADILGGDSGNNFLSGAAGNDLLAGGAGDDTLFGGVGADYLDGGNGRDNLIGGDGADTLIGGAGIDFFDGGAGYDIIDYHLESAGVVAYLFDPSSSPTPATLDHISGVEEVIGTIFSDSIFGDGVANKLGGGGGGDFLSSRAGDDTLLGDEGNDTLEGGAGADSINGGAGFDIASYANAAAAVRVALWDPALNTGDAAGDIIQFTTEAVFGTRFADNIQGNSSANNLRGGDGNDFILGGFGNDTLVGGAGADDMGGGAGFDVTSYAGGGAVRVALWNPSLNTGDATGDNIRADIEVVEGSFFNDTLEGSSAANNLRGSFGHDRISGGGGNDTLSGDFGNDTLDGGAGNDLLIGGGANDVFVYSANGGADVIADFLSGSSAIDVIRLAGLGAVFDSFAEVISAATQNGADTLINFGGGNTLTLQNILIADLDPDDFAFG